MFSDELTYRTLTQDPTDAVRIALKRTLQKGICLGVINDKIKQHLLPKPPVCPVFHAFPKTHIGFFSPPMRPIIAGIGSLIENTCTWLDNLLQPLVQRKSGYIKDTKELLKAFNDVEWQSNYRWVTFDIVALYTCIRHDKAL